MPEEAEVPRPSRRSVLLSTRAGFLGLVFLGLIFAVCLFSLPWTLGSAEVSGTRAAPGGPVFSTRYDDQDRKAQRLPPTWWRYTEEQASRYEALAADHALRRMADEQRATPDALSLQGVEPAAAAIQSARPFYIMGTDALGRDVLTRCLLGGAISLTIGLAAAAISVVIGTLYGAIAGWLGGRVDGLMMRVVDILYGLPYILLVVLMAVAVDAALDRWQGARAAQARSHVELYIADRSAALPTANRADPASLRRLRSEAVAIYGTGDLAAWQVQAINVATLLAAIGGVSWLTMARVVRGQVLSLKARPFMEAARAVGVGPLRLFLRHLLPNLTGPIIVYATLTVPQAILQESFLSFLGIGVKPPLPSWGNLAADGLQELNTVQSQWWLLAFPCVLLGGTLLAMNFLGEGLREAMDPRRTGGRA